jgi:hypothetical protein
MNTVRSDFPPSAFMDFGLRWNDGASFGGRQPVIPDLIRDP